MLYTLLLVAGGIIGLAVLGYLGLVLYTIFFDESGTA